MAKKVLGLLLIGVMMIGMVACGSKDTSSDAQTDETTSSIQYMTPKEVEAVLGDKTYKLLDLRKTEDYDKGHIEDAVAADMDAAVNGDTAKGEEVMKEATKDYSDNLVLVCYSGGKYADAAIEALRANGYPSDKVFVLEGGMKAWDKDGLPVVK